MSAAAIAETIRRYRFVYNGEAELQAAIREALERDGFHVETEARISDDCRVDLLVGRVAVEVKVAGTTVEVGRQVRRYLATGVLDEIVLATRRVSHLNVPYLIADDRVLVVALPLSGGGL